MNYTDNGLEEQSGTKSPAPKGNSTIVSQLNIQEKTLEKLIDTINDLHARLIPVLNEEPTTTDQNAECAEALCDISARVRANTMSIDTAIERIHYLIRTVDL